MQQKKMTPGEIEGLVADARGAIYAAALALFMTSPKDVQNNALSASGYNTTNRKWIIGDVIPRVRLSPCPMTRSLSNVDTTDLLDELKESLSQPSQ